MTGNSNLPSLTIGVPAFNEEANIVASIDGALEQKGISVEQIIIISDGSNDDTEELIENYPDDRVRLVRHRDRRGKSARLNEILALAKSTILVLMDADVQLETNHTLAALIQPIVEGEASLACGRPVQRRTFKFFDNVMRVSQILQEEIKAKLHRGHSVYACHGRLLALHRDVYSKLVLPESAVADDAFIYFSNEATGHGFKYVPQATVAFRMPQNPGDFIKQQRRFAHTESEQKRVFGEEEVAAAYAIPPRLKLAAMLKAAHKLPLHLLAYLLLRLASVLYPNSDRSAWKVSASTKKI